MYRPEFFSPHRLFSQIGNAKLLYVCPAFFCIRRFRSLGYYDPSGLFIAVVRILKDVEIASLLAGWISPIRFL